MKQPSQPIVLDEKGTPRFQSNEIIKFLFNTGQLDLNKLTMMVKQGAFPLEDYAQITQLLGYSVSGWGDLSTSPPNDVGAADAEAAMIVNGDKQRYLEEAQGLCRDVCSTSLEIGGAGVEMQVDDDARIAPADDACWVQAWLRIPKEVIE